MSLTKSEIQKHFEKGLDAVVLLISEIEKKASKEKPKEHEPAAHQLAIVELDTSIPSTRQLHTMIRAKEPIEIKLRTGEEIKGTVQWLDPDCICVQTTQAEPNHDFVIWQHAIAFIKA